MFSLIVKLAWNNAFSRLSRTLLVITMIAVSMSMMLSIQGLYDGMTLNMIDKTKRSDSGEISIYADKYRLNKILQHRLHDTQKIKNALQQDESIEAIAIRLSVEGLSSTARKSSFSSIIGIDLDDEERFGNFSAFLKEGAISFDKRGAIIGSELAKTLKIRIGSKVIFSTQDSTGEINAMALKIRGIVQTSNIMLDATALYVDIKSLRKFLAVASDDATQIALRTQSDTLLAKLHDAYPKLDIKSFMQLYPMLKQMKDMMVIFNSITFVIVMLVVFIGILGVMYVSILDRIREFGIMRGIGMPYRTIRTQIFLEAFFVGIVGYLIGALLGVVALLYLHYYGLDLSSFADGMESFGMSPVLYAQIQMSYFTSTFFAIITSSLLSVILPLRKIKHLNVIDVIKADT
jgi:ABC-type lipoprotein release transport system permease subunit